MSSRGSEYNDRRDQVTNPMIMVSGDSFAKTSPLTPQFEQCSYGEICFLFLQSMESPFSLFGWKEQKIVVKTNCLMLLRPPSVFLQYRNGSESECRGSLGLSSRKEKKKRSLPACLPRDALPDHSFVFPLENRMKNEKNHKQPIHHPTPILDCFG